MRETIAGINPKVLTWARVRSGQSLEQVAHAMGQKEGVIEDWESGEALPTYRQLEKLAYTVFKRPIAIFFFPEPPKEIDSEHQFRTVPSPILSELSSDTLLKVREAKATVLSLRELTGGKNPSHRQIVRDSSIPKTTAGECAKAVRRYLGISLDQQTKEWKKITEALKHWREAIEGAGIFVFKDSFKQESISGFALHDEEFPIIVLNNSTTASRQIFTLFHELAHLILGESGITKEEGYVTSLSLYGNSKIEAFCNAFAAEFLAPVERIRELVQMQGVSDATIASLANSFKVSRHVILLRLVTLGIISQDRYETSVADWNRSFQNSKNEDKASGGGNYYLTMRSYLSDRYTKLAFGNYYRGTISIDQLAGYLGIKAKNVPTFEAHAFERRPG